MTGAQYISSDSVANIKSLHVGELERIIQQFNRKQVESGRLGAIFSQEGQLNGLYFIPYNPLLPGIDVKAEIEGLIKQ